MTNKKDDKITKASAVELEENELDQVTGGANDGKHFEGIVKNPIGGAVIKDPIAKSPSGWVDKSDQSDRD